MPHFDQPLDQQPHKDVSISASDDIDLKEVLKTVPRGALALAAIALLFLMAAWLFVYFFVFLERGPIS